MSWVNSARHALRFVIAGAAVFAGPAAAVSDGNINSTIDPSVVAIDEPEYLGTPIARDFVLVDENGREFTLGEAMGKPLILLFSYYTCDGVCETLNKHLADRLAEMEAASPGRDYRALTISFDRNDDPASLRHFVSMLDIPEHLKERWTVSVLRNGDDIKRLTDSVGVRYFWSYRDKVFVHPNAFIFVTPKGRIARYLHGAAFDARDMEMALIDADWEKISSARRVIDILAAACFSYNFKEGRYTFNYPLVIGVTSLLAGIFVVAIAFMVARKKKMRSVKHAQQQIA
ncbi:MAG TPA: SCO family protein [Gammaproteobacteria bacterium]|nr:SCO family protein [Gammaproteobacteria bacterium]